MVKLRELLYFEHLIIANYIFGILTMFDRWYWFSLYFFVCGTIWWKFVEWPKTKRCGKCYGSGVCLDCNGAGKLLC